MLELQAFSRSWAVHVVKHGIGRSLMPRRREGSVWSGIFRQLPQCWSVGVSTGSLCCVSVVRRDDRFHVATARWLARLWLFFGSRHFSGLLRSRSISLLAFSLSLLSRPLVAFPREFRIRHRFEHEIGSGTRVVFPAVPMSEENCRL